METQRPEARVVPSAKVNFFSPTESDSTTPDSAYHAWQWVPPMAFMRVMVFLSQASTLDYAVTLANWWVLTTKA